MVDNAEVFTPRTDPDGFTYGMVGAGTAVTGDLIAGDPGDDLILGDEGTITLKAVAQTMC